MKVLVKIMDEQIKNINKNNNNISDKKRDKWK